MAEGFQDDDGGAGGLQWIEKDPSDILDYKRDWRADDALAADESIAGVAWEISDLDWAPISGGDALALGTAEYAPIHDDDTATVWLTGGKPGAGVGTRYYVTCRVTTTSTPPRRRDASFQVRVKQR